MRFYLCGAIDRASDNGKAWRENLEPTIAKFGGICINPLKKPINVGLETDDHRYERVIASNCQNYDKLQQIMKLVRAVDLRLIEVSDVILVNLDTNIHLCGTMEEIFWANRQKKPIIVVCPQGKPNIPDWLFGTLPHQMFFSTWMEAITYLQHIDEDLVIEHRKRWFFYNAGWDK